MIADDKKNKEQPKTRIIINSIIKDIHDGVLRNGDRLPSVRELSQKHNSSIAVGLSAYKFLEKNNWVVREPGRGTFVSYDDTQLHDLKVVNWNLILPQDIMQAIQDSLLEGKFGIAHEIINYATAEYIDYRKYISFLKNRQAPNEQTDIVALNEGLLPVMAAEDLIIPLNELLAQAKNNLSRKFPDKLLQHLKYNGKLYALPLNWSPALLIYNREIFAKSGMKIPENSWTWEDLYRITTRLTRQDSEGRIIQHGLGIVFSINAIAPFVFQNNGELFDHSGSCVISKPETSEALDFFSRLYSLPGVCSHRYGDPRSALADLLTNNMLPLLIGDATDYLIIKDRMSADEWGVISLPHQKTGATSISIMGLGVSRKCRNPEKALEWLVEFYNRYEKSQFNGIIPNFPSTTKQLASFPEICQQLLEQSRVSLQSPSINAFEAINSTLITAINHKIALSEKNYIDFMNKINKVL